MDTVRRAFELAESGQCGSMDHLRKRLHKERMDQVEAHLSGSSLRNQLMRIIHASNAARPKGGNVAR